MAPSASIWLSCLVVVAALAFSSVSADEKKEVAAPTRGRELYPDDVIALCNMKDVEISSITHVNTFFQLLGNRECSHACNRRVETAVIELHDIVNENADDVCTQKKADQIADWFKLYGIFNPDNIVFIPKPLQRFFYAYGLRLSDACRKNMLAHLVEDSHKQLTPEDYEVFNKWTNEESFLARMIKEPKDFDDLQLPKKLNKVLKKPDEEEKKIYIETPTAGEIKRIQYHCQKRFKPFYSKLILPLITLSEAHFNHRGESVERDVALSKEVYQWYRIVFMCESLADIEIIENPEGAKVSAAEGDKDADGQAKKRVKLLNKEQAEELKRLVPQQEDTLEQLEYEPNKVSLDDNILDNNNLGLVKTLNSFQFKFPVNEVYDLVEPKFMKKTLKFMQTSLKKAPIYIASKVSGMKGTTSEKKFNDQMLVKFIDDYQGQLERGEKPRGLFHEIKWLWELNKVKIITGILMVSYIIMSTTLFHVFAG